jgi:serine/threonine-protein kinase
MDQIGRYQLQAEIGRGGFGRVYKAFDPTVGRTVAIKVLVSSGDQDILTRFRNEAAATGKLRHRNIITIFDFGEQDGVPYLVMEYLEGKDLQGVSSSGRQLTLLEKLSIMSQVADGLHHAHINQIVHRDVKPANIMLLNDGTVKIMDFGIARLLSSHSTRLTQHGNLIGTISYMAPEQFLGNDVNELSDIFAYGTIFYELLTGEHPFKASDAPAIIYRITAVEPKPVGALVPDCPPALEQIIVRAIHKRPELRYQSLEDLQFDLVPIKLLLQRQLAESLVQKARDAFSSGDIDGANRITREALEHDPNNALARELREKIKRDAQIRVIRARSNDSITAAKQDIAAGLHSRALQTLEAAIRLDPENSAVIALLEEVKEALEKANRATNLLAQARRELEAQNLTNAYRDVVECLQNAPDSKEAAALLNNVRKEIEKRERERRFEEALAKIESLAAAESHDEALGMLADLEADNPGSQRVKQLLANVHYTKQEKERQRQLLADLNAAKGLIANSRWNAAVDQLQRLLRQWPSNGEVKQLLGFAQDRQTAERHAEEVERIVKESGNLAVAHEFERALNLINGGLLASPSDQELNRALEKTQQARRAYERECAIQEASERIREQAGRKQFAEALGEVDTAIRTLNAPVLTELKLQVQREQQQHEQEQAILIAKQNARRLLESGNFFDAVESLRDAVGRFPDEPEFADLLGLAEARLEERLRADAIAAVIRNAAARVQKSEFDEALADLREGLQRFPKEGQLLARVKETEAAKLVFHRTRAETHWKEQRWNEALQAVESSLREYKDEPTLLALQKAIKEDWERRQRIAAVAGAAQEAQRLSSSGQIDDAIAVLEQAVRSYPNEEPLVRLLATNKELRANEARRLAIENIIREAAGMLDAQRFEQAIETLRGGLTSYPAEPQLTEWLDRARKTEAEETRRRAVRKVIDAASTLIENQQYDAAIAALGKEVKKYPDEPELRELLKRAAETKTEEAHRQAISKLAAEAGALIEKGDFQPAINALTRGLESNRGERQLTSLLRQAEQGKAEADRKQAVQIALEHASKLEQSGDLNKALQTLEQALQKAANDPSLMEAKAALQAQIEKRTAFDRLLAQARQLKDKQSFDQALRVLADAGKINPEEPAIALLRVEIEAAKADVELTQLIGSISALRSKGKLQEAVSQIEEALKLYPGRDRLLDLRKQIAADLEAGKRREAAAAAATQAQQLLDRGKLDEALSVLEPAAREYPEAGGLSSLIAYVNETKAARERADEVSRIMREARSLINSGKWVEAISLLQPALERFPNEENIHSLLEKARAEKTSRERAQAVAQALSEAETHRSQRRYAEALRVLDDVLKKYGEDAAVRTTRQAIAAEQDASEEGARIAAALAAGRQHLEEGQADAAVKVLREALLRDAGHAGLTTALAEAEQISRVEAALARNQFAQALEIVAAALAAQLGDEKLLNLKDRIEARQRESAIKDAIARAEAALAKNQFSEASEIVTAAIAAQPGEEKLLKLKGRIESGQRESAIKDAISHAEAALARNQFVEASTIVTAALAAQPGEERLLNLKGRIESGQRESAIKDAISRAEAALTKNQFPEALQIVIAAIATQPGEEKLLKLKSRIESRAAAEQIAQQRKADIASLKQIADQAKRAADVATLDELSTAALTIASSYSGDSEVKAAQGKVQSEIKSRTASLTGKTKSVPSKPVVTEALPRPVPIPEQAEQTSNLPKYATIAAGLAALIFGGVYFLGSKKTTPAGVSMQVRVSPAGATVRAGDQTCSQADCKFTLTPGKYEVSAKLPGYEPATQSVTVDATDLNLNLTLSPLPAKLSISTNLETGVITLDGKPAGKLEGGALRVDAVAPGTHSLKIAGADREETSFQFEVKPGELPKLVGKLDAKELEALVVTNLDAKAEFVSHDPGQPVTVGGREVPVNGSGVRQSDSLGAGPLEVKAGAANSPVYLLNTGPAPSVTVFVHASRDTGTLLVETRQDGAVVFIDNKRYSQTTQQGVISIPLPARKYTIRVEKPGFDSPPSQQVQVVTSKVNRMAFNLVAQRGTLLISGALDGTNVKLDGNLLGVIRGNNTFQVPAGDHTVELAKDRYVSKQVRLTVAPGAKVELGRPQVLLTEIPAAAPLPAPPVESPKVPPVTLTPADARDWEQLKDSRDVAALEGFRRKYPNSSFSEQAARRLDDIRKQAEIVKKQQLEQAETAARLKAEAAEAQKRTQDTQAIRGAIDRYAKAFESKDLDTLKAVWPGMPSQTQTTLRRTFREAKSISLKLRPDSVEVNGNSAVAACSRELRQMLDRPLDLADKVIIRLKRDDKSWVIDSIQ